MARFSDAVRRPAIKIRIPANRRSNFAAVKGFAFLRLGEGARLASMQDHSPIGRTMPNITRVARLGVQSNTDYATPPSGQQPGATSPQSPQRPRTIQGALLGLLGFRARGHAGRANVTHQPPPPPTGYPVHPGQFQGPYHQAPQPYGHGSAASASHWRAEDFQGFHTQRAERERQAGGPSPSTPQRGAENFQGFHTQRVEREQQAGGASPSAPQWRAENFQGFHTQRVEREQQAGGAIPSAPQWRAENFQGFHTQRAERERQAGGASPSAPQWRAENFQGFHTQRAERERQAGGASPSAPQWRAENFQGFHTQRAERERQAGGPIPSAPQWGAENFQGFHTNRGQRAAQGDGTQAGQRSTANDARFSRPPRWYEVLGVNPHTMTLEQVKAIYKREARRWHPDKGGDTAKFQALWAAYQSALMELQGRR